MSIAFAPVILTNTADRRRLLTALALQLRNTLPTRGRAGIPQGMRTFLSNPAGLQLLFGMISEGKDTITHDQFRKFISQYPQVPAALFDLLDTNDDGILTRDEFQQLGQLLPGGV